MTAWSDLNPWFDGSTSSFDETAPMWDDSALWSDADIPAARSNDFRHRSLQTTGRSAALLTGKLMHKNQRTMMLAGSSQ